MPSSKYTGMIVEGSSQGINALGSSILKVGSLILFVCCGRLINYMLCFPHYLYTYHFIFICIYTLFFSINNIYMFNIYSYYNYFNI